VLIIFQFYQSAYKRFLTPIKPNVLLFIYMIELVGTLIFIALAGICYKLINYGAKKHLDNIHMDYELREQQKGNFPPRI
jgi:hypothetical protein